MNKTVLLAGAFLLAWAGSAWSCTGPEGFASTLHPVAESLAANFPGGSAIEPLRFFDPFRLAGLHGGDRLVQIAYQESPVAGESPVAAERALFDHSLAAGERAAARDAARRTIDTLLSLPAPLATPWGVELQRAVEFVEIEPALGDTDAALVAAAFAGTPAHGGTPLLDQTLAIRAAPFDQAAATLARFPDSPRRPSLELAALRNVSFR